MSRPYQTVIVVNQEAPLGPLVRHIIKINGVFDGEQFKKEYYESFRQLPGDLFIYCHTFEAFVENMKKYDESFKQWEESKNGSQTK